MQRKKSVAQEVRQKKIFRNIEVRVEGDIDPFNPYFVCNASNCVTVRPVRGHLTPKMNIAFFIRNLMLNIFLLNNFFEKSNIVGENRGKFWGENMTIFQEKGSSFAKN